MTEDTLNKHLEDALRLENLTWPPDDMVKVLRIIQNTFQKLNPPDQALLLELRELGRFIEQAKSDISSIHAEEIQSTHIPNATDELDAIVGATADATGTIMDACEKIEGIAQTQEASINQAITDEVTKIYEACSFQDITGQRISKVVKALKMIDDKVAALMRTFGVKVDMDKKAEDTRQGDARLLNGPQLQGKGATQDDIDSLFN